jgi:hypothetical protein
MKSHCPKLKNCDFGLKRKKGNNIARAQSSIFNVCGSIMWKETFHQGEIHLDRVLAFTKKIVVYIYRLQVKEDREVFQHDHPEAKLDQLFHHQYKSEVEDESLIGQYVLFTFLKFLQLFNCFDD